MAKPIPVLDPTGPLMAPPETAGVLGVTLGHLAQLRYTGRGPRFIKLNGRAVRYRRIDVAEWLEQNLHTSTGGAA
jgi:predicted DNA-binding transcriptional regulator AlpA